MTSLNPATATTPLDAAMCELDHHSNAGTMSA